MKKRVYQNVIKRLKKLLTFLKINPHASYDEMMSLFGIKSVSYIQKMLNKLEKSGKIRRIKSGKKTVKYRVKTRRHKEVNKQIQKQVKNENIKKTIPMPEITKSTEQNKKDNNITEKELSDMLSGL